MICHRHKSIFIHQRKCAGNSIIRAFDIDAENPDWHFMNDGVLSPDFKSAPTDYFIFAVIRNPWDRFISGWKYCATTRDRTLRDVLQNLPSKGHDYRHLTRQQYATLYNSEGRSITDYLIRYESLQQGFDQVSDIIGKPRRKLAHHNRGNRRRYTDYFDEECQQLFIHHYGRDIELFGYDF